MKGLKIRDFEDRDLKTILKYRQQSARISFPDFRIDMEKAKAFIKEHIEKHPGTLKVAEVDGEVVGFIRFNQEDGSFGPYGLIGIIFVDKPHRRHGVGEALLQEAERWFGSKGIRLVEAGVTNTNVPSLEFFRSHGYEEERTVFRKMIE